jgi:type IV pilus assembly protein PilM
MKFSFKDFLKGLQEKKGESVLGVDIGSSDIKIVQLRKEKERAVLETYGEIALGPYSNLGVGQVAQLSEMKTVEALKDVLREANAKGKRAAVSIALKSSFVTIIEVPSIENVDLAEMIKLEARRYVPVSISEVEIDWWVIPQKEDKEEEEEKEGENAGKKLTKILLVAIHKDVISKHKRVIGGAGLELGVLEIESFSMIRSSISKALQSVVVVDLGASSTKIAIVDYGIMMGSHSVAKGGQDLTNAVSHALGVDFNRAESMKRETGLSSLPEHKEIVNVMEPILNYIFSEINGVIKDYQTKHKRVPSQMILTGGGALLKGIKDFAARQLSIEISVADPFTKTEYPAFLNDALKQTGPTFSVALGLALRELR